MPDKAGRQPEFTELFSPSQLRQVMTVGQLTTRVRRLIEGQLGRVWVTGEVTNLRAQSSGHLYFTLKDAAAQLSCVLFRGEAAGARQHVQEGQSLILGGELTVYEPRGQYQLKVQSVELQGVGALQVAFEQLKKRLQAEGLFAQERKRPMPKYPQRIGIVTSPTGAALHDVLQVIRRRQPGLQIVLAPSRVQGQGAAAEIARAIADLNQIHASGLRTLDVILITRGGGSLEDLWAFNEEVVARAIHASGLPLVSAVGHEIDFTISDWVADLRAATPTAAAEILTEGAFSSRQLVAQAGERLKRLMSRRLESEREAIGLLVERLSRVSPRRWLEEKSQLLDELQGSMGRILRSEVRIRGTAVGGLAARVLAARPARRLGELRRRLSESSRRLHAAARQNLVPLRARMNTLQVSLQILSPTSVLQRGYTITRDARTGEVVKTAAQAGEVESFVTQFVDGQVSTVKVR